MVNIVPPMKKRFYLIYIICCLLINILYILVFAIISLILIPVFLINLLRILYI